MQSIHELERLRDVFMYRYCRRTSLIVHVNTENEE
jgi:hypothetical protein